MNRTPGLANNPAVAGERPVGSGLEFSVARSIDEILQAWELVYAAYTKTGLIDENPHRIHLVPHAIHPGTAVIVGTIHGSVASTMTVSIDRPGGLPLDQVYPAELNTLRRSGRRLVEVGLFADRREQIARSFSALIELMRHVFYFAVHSGATDIVIGVHPDHSSFYERFLGFETFAHTAGCPFVKGNPMVPMRLRLHESLLLVPLPKGLTSFKAKPLSSSAFAARLVIQPPLFANTSVEAYLRDSPRHGSAA